MHNIPIGSLMMAVLFWISGYLQIKFLEDENSKKLLHCPLWLFIILGMPTNRFLPKRVLSLTSVSLQLMGLLFFVYIFTFRLFINIDTIYHELIQYLSSMILGALIGYWLYKRYCYKSL